MKKIFCLSLVFVALVACEEEEASDGDDEDTYGLVRASSIPGGVCGDRAQIVGTTGDDPLQATPAGDCVLGLRGNDVLYGKEGSDVLVGGKGGDILHGGRGDDTLVGGLGPDTLNGGRGNDLYLFYPPDDQNATNDTINDDAGTNTIQCMDGLKAVSSEMQGTQAVFRFPNGGTLTIPLAGAGVDRFRLVDCGATWPSVPGSEFNSFRAIGKTDEDVRAHLDAEWQKFKAGYIPKPGAVNWYDNASVESQTRALLTAYALDKQEDFEAILSWTNENMLITKAKFPNYTGNNLDYMAWAVNLADPSKPCTNHCSYANGKKEDVGPAADGEIWFTTGLFLGGKRWNKPQWIEQGKRNLIRYTVQPQDSISVPLFDQSALLPVFAPGKFSRALRPGEPANPPPPKFTEFTSPAYVIPSFFQLWSSYSTAMDWSAAAAAGRTWLDRATHPTTGLIAESNDFTGKAVDGSTTNNGLLHASDSIQAAVNRVLDWQAGNKAPSISKNAQDIVTFFDSRRTDRFYTPAGEPTSQQANGIATKCMVAVWAALLPPSEMQQRWLNNLWSESGNDWYSAQYCLLGKVIAAGLLKTQ
jgi:endo-1,4-beta-D-glucanase Y